MYSYHAHVHTLYSVALSKAAAVLVASERCSQHHPKSAEFPDTLGELRARFGDLQVAVDALFAVVPNEVATVGELKRHMHFGNVYINIKDQPGGWGSDAQLVLERDLPAILHAFNDWYATASGVDPELVERLRPFNGVSHINSAGREAWAIFKTRLIEAFDLPKDLDGHKPLDGYRLVKRLFDGDNPEIATLPEQERQAYSNLLKGLYSLNRNLLAHNDAHPNPAETDAVIALLGICLSRIAPPKADADK